GKMNLTGSTDFASISQRDDHGIWHTGNVPLKRPESHSPPPDSDPDSPGKNLLPDFYRYCPMPVADHVRTGRRACSAQWHHGSTFDRATCRVHREIHGYNSADQQSYSSSAPR